MRRLCESLSYCRSAHGLLFWSARPRSTVEGKRLDTITVRETRSIVEKLWINQPETGPR